MAALVLLEDTLPDVLGSLLEEAVVWKPELEAPRVRGADDGGAGVGAGAEAAEDVDAEDEVEDELAEAAVPVTDAEVGTPVGGALVVTPPMSEPTPQGIAAPPGWVGFVAGTVAPEGLAIVKRVVHKVFCEAGEVNW